LPSDDADNGLWTDADEPSPDDFEAAEEEPQAGARMILVRILRLVGVLFLILALLLYFVAPFRVAVIGALRELRLQSPKLQQIPLAPEPKDNPRLPT
jgi:hypothetical protein